MKAKNSDAQRLIGQRQKVDTAALQALDPRERLRVLVGSLTAVGGTGAGDGAAFRRRLAARLASSTRASRQGRAPRRQD
jgi:hypothetical protein